MNQKGNKSMDDRLRVEFLRIFAGLDENDQKAHDTFFEDRRFFPGNDVGQTYLPYDRFLIYESNLKVLETNDQNKFRRIHKGTPYYFLAWTAFDFRDFQRAIFYMDAAVSEDIRRDPKGWQLAPASQFMFLRKDEGGQTAQRITREAHSCIEASVTQFSCVFSLALTVEGLVERFVKVNLHDKTHRSIITSLYSFVLEAGDLELQLSLRSVDGGSVEPFLLHLLKGCLIFESILKEIYTGMAGSELGHILKDPFISRDLNYKNGLIDNTASVRKTLQDIVKHLWPFLQKESPSDRTITIAYALRNTTSHSLLWPDVFPQHYVDLYKSILFSIYYVIAKKY